MSERVNKLSLFAACAVAALTIIDSAGIGHAAQAPSSPNKELLDSLSPEDRAKLAARLAAQKPMTTEQLERAIAAGIERQEAILGEMDEAQLSALAARGDEVWRDCALAHGSSLFFAAKPNETEQMASRRGYMKDIARIRATLYESARSHLSGRDDYAANGDAKIVEVRKLIEEKPADTDLQLCARSSALRCDVLLLPSKDRPLSIEAALMTEPVRAAKEAAEHSE